MRTLLAGLLIWSGSFGIAVADDVRVAVAANFRDTLQELAAEFETLTGHRIIASPGSTGRIYAQIINGAPFDLFLAADAQRPRLLVENGVVAATNRFDYAIGQLVVWSLTELPSGAPATWLAELDSLAIANPRLAPYGLAASQTLTTLNIRSEAGPRIIMGENVSQAFQFAGSGNVSAGLVALAQMRLPAAQAGHYRDIPETLHQPILQQGVLLTDAPAATALRDFLLGDTARAIIESHGYRLPDKGSD